MNLIGKSVRNSYILPARRASDFPFTQSFFWSAQKQTFGEKQFLILQTVHFQTVLFQNKKMFVCMWR